LDQDFRESVHAANVKVHRFEAQNYEVLHPEVYGREEQERVYSTLKIVDHLVASNSRRALDFGAGTGNLTGKLLRMGYSVVAVDISAEMCSILSRRYCNFVSRGKLSIVNSPIEEAGFSREEFDVIACYSVLHHLPDYVETIEKLSSILRKGGVIYIDHEASPSYWARETSALANLIKSLYFHSNPILNAFYFSIAGIQVPKVDYVLSDYWHKKEHPLDHNLIKRIFEEENFLFAKRIDYHSKASWIPNPLFLVFRYFCKPEMSYWIAQK
jgi:2-polyprenyl-3-methyl-5-hydroxy-6-metoxy-1,4-benzoquinol methylase